MNAQQTKDVKAAAGTLAYFAADFTSSWLCYVCSLAVSHPLDTMRLRLQTHNQSPMHTLRVDGVRSLYAGMITPMVANGPLVGVVFAFNEFYRAIGRWLNVNVLGNEGVSQLPYFTVGELAFAGGMAGLSSSLWQCPVSTVRIHQQVSARAASPRKLSSIDVITELWRCEGIRGFYRAWVFEAMTNCIGRLVYFTAYEVFKEQIALAVPSKPDSPHATLHKVVAAIMTSTVGWIAIFPMDLVKNRLQADTISVNPKDRQFKGFAHCCRVVYQEKGLRGFWAGFGLTITRSAMSSGVSLPLFDVMKPMFRGMVSQVSDEPEPGATSFRATSVESRDNDGGGVASPVAGKLTR